MLGTKVFPVPTISQVLSPNRVPLGVESPFGLHPRYFGLRHTEGVRVAGKLTLLRSGLG